MLEKTIQLYAFPPHNTVKSAHILVKNGQTNRSNLT